MPTRSFVRFCAAAFSLLWGSPVDAQFIPDPANAQLTLVTPSWLVWTKETALPRSGPVDYGSTRISVYIQTEPDQPAWKVYEEVVGMINNFQPVWVWKDGSVVSWSGWFSFARKGILHEPEAIMDTIPGATEMPVLRSMGDRGVIVMVPKEAVSMTSTHRLYFVPWTWDKRILDYRQARLITDDDGIGYWSGQVLYANGKFVASRSEKVFCYDSYTSKTDTLRLTSISPKISSSPTGFDGQNVLIQTDTSLTFVQLADRSEQSIRISRDWQWIGLKGRFGYGFTIDADSAIQRYRLTRRDLLSGTEEIFATIRLNAQAEDFQEPACFIRGNKLWLWLDGRWKSFKI